MRNHVGSVKDGTEVEKMGVDKVTEPKSVNIVLNDSKMYLDSLREQASENDQNDEDCVGERGCKALSVTDDKYVFSMEEYYFDEDDGAISVSGELNSAHGKTSVYLSIPLSDVVLIDILQYSIKKLNKLKTAMETLK